MVNRRALGYQGESLAIEYLIESGYTHLARNLRTPYGELDLLMEKDGVLVFFEVKTRTSFEFGYPEEAITRKKYEHLLNTALFYLQEHPELTGEWRIDVIAILWKGKKNSQIHHIQNISGGSG